MLVPQRIMNKLYVGQSPNEEQHKDAVAYIDGKLVAKEIVSIERTDEFKQLNRRIKDLESEIILLKARVKDIYKQDEFTNKIPGRNNTSGRGK